MSKLSKEQIESILARYQYSLDSGPAVHYDVKTIRALCDMALSSIADEEDAAAYKAVLIGMEFKDVDSLPAKGAQYCLELGKAAAYQGKNLFISAAMKGASHE